MMLSGAARSKRIAKGALSFGLVVSMVIGTISAHDTKANAESTYNYGDAFAKSLMFYEFQKSGDLPDKQRNNWRGDSGMGDGADVGRDLTGGWYDAGDHVKFNLPMSYTATMLAWSYLEDTNVYKASGQEVYMLDEIKWANDYFIKCHPSPNEYYYQVGNGSADHSAWTSAEVMQMERPSYKLDMNNPGSAVSAETAASLAACSIVFKDSNPTYSQTCLKHAKELLAFAEATKSDAGYMKQAAGFYSSYSGFNDELSWANMWLYLATKDTNYIAKAKSYSGGWSKEEQSKEIGYTWAQNWDDVHIGTCLLLAKYTGDKTYKDIIEKHLDYWTVGVNGSRIKYTPKGLAWLDSWGSLRYATTTAFLAAIYADWSGADPKRAGYCQTFAKSQADYALGSTGRSFVIGFGTNYPKNPHHRTAHGGWENNSGGHPADSRHVLVGALVGGPDANDNYTDLRTDYTANEVADDYNAGLVGLMAKMYGDYGGKIDANLNAVEKIGEELYLESAINAQDRYNNSNFIELKTVVYNKTAWPARVTDKLSFRYYVDISDVLATGYSAKDMKITCSYSQGNAQVTGLHPWNISKGLYYVDVNLNGNKIYPGGQSQHKYEIQFRIAAPGRWDYTKSPSYQGLSNSLTKAVNMALYDNGKLVYGSEPYGRTAVTPTPVPYKPTATPTVTPTPLPNKVYTPSNSDVKVMLEPMNGNSTNQLGGQLYLTSNSTIALNRVKIRYYYTLEGNASQNTFVDYAGINMTNSPWYVELTRTVSMSVVHVRDNLYYYELTSNSNQVLEKDGKVQMCIRVAKSDWSNYDQSNDHSYQNGAVVLYDNSVVCGTIPY